MKKFIPLSVKIFILNFINGNYIKQFRLFLSNFNKNDLKELGEFLKSLTPVKTEFDLVRIGSKNDGGYLIPNDFNDLKFCFSPGVSVNSDFEKHLYDEYKIKSFLCDFSVDKPSIDCEGFVFSKKFLGSKNDKIFFTLKNWLQKSEYKGELLLQMDIEGFEYPVLIKEDLELIKNFRILVIEFHDLDRLFTRFGFNIITSVFHKLLDDYYIVHIHPNNLSYVFKKGDIKIPQVMELTFLRKDRVKINSKYEDFPHYLDAKNNNEIKDVILPKCFY